MALALCLGLLVSCADNPYVIGRVVDARVEPVPPEPDAGPSYCPPGALFCAGFEAQDVAEGWSSTSIILDAAIERTTGRVHSGQGALRAESRGPDSAAVVARALAPLRSGSLYVRAYLYLAAAVPTETMNIFFIGADPADPFIGIDFNLEDGAFQMFSPQSEPSRVTGSLAIARDRWVCVRVEVAIADSGGAVRVHADDAPALEVTGIDTLSTDGIRLFRAGIDWSSEQDAFFEIFMDDIALATAPIGCD